MERPKVATANGRHVVVGEMCPTAAAGRAAILPMIMRGVSWSDKPDELASQVEHGATPRYVVIGGAGKTIGVFDTVGLEDVQGVAQPIASGAYVGAAPCAVDDGKGGKIDDTACVLATGGCGLALADISRSDDLVETPVFAQGADVCFTENAIVVDIDGDKVMESFPLEQVLDGIRGPTAEWTALATPGAPCAKGKPQIYGMPVEVRDKQGKADAKATVTVSVLAAIDLDGDGRKELILALQFPTVRTVVVYSPVDMAQRLELVGEGTAISM
jgi:hypothetical protein